MEKCTHLKYSAADVPVTAVTPDPKLSVVVSLTVRYPIPARDTKKGTTKQQQNFPAIFTKDFSFVTSKNVHLNKYCGCHLVD